MSYNLIIVLLLVMLPINSLIAFLCYRQGLRDAIDKENNKELKPLEPLVDLKELSLKIKKAEKKQNENAERLNIILENINNYKGNGVGQREVK